MLFVHLQLQIVALMSQLIPGKEKGMGNFYLQNSKQRYWVSSRPSEIMYLHTFISYEVCNINYAIDGLSVDLDFSTEY